MNPVGCSIWADLYFDFDSVQVPHGRTPAGATGVKRMLPDHLVVCYQGDGDLAAIGTAEIVHAANRGEKFTTIFVNNAIYGMTGGPDGADHPRGPEGHDRAHGPRSRTRARAWAIPIRVCEMLATLGGTKYLARGSVDTRGQRAQDQAVHQEGLRGPAPRRGLHDGRDPLSLPDQLADGPGRGRRLGQRRR